MEATGLGGRDLLYPIPWDISIRSDKEGQSIYGPSLAPMEETVEVPGIFEGTETVQVTALGRSKAAHEFLVLHYFGLDSAKHWDALLFDVLPAVQFPSGYCFGNVWSLAHCTVPPQNAPCIVDRLNEFGLEPFDGWQNGTIHGFPRHTGI